MLVVISFCWWCLGQFISSTEILISRAISHDTPPVPWRVEPGQLKVVAIDTGPGVVLLNPEDGGVVVANVWAHAVVQDNKSLHIYQSTKEVQVAGAGFNNDTLVISRSRAPSLCSVVTLRNTSQRMFFRGYSGWYYSVVAIVLFVFGETRCSLTSKPGPFGAGVVGCLYVV